MQTIRSQLRKLEGWPADPIEEHLIPDIAALVREYATRPVIGHHRLFDLMVVSSEFRRLWDLHNIRKPSDIGQMPKVWFRENAGIARREDTDYRFGIVKSVIREEDILVGVSDSDFDSTSDDDDSDAD